MTWANRGATVALFTILPMAASAQGPERVIAADDAMFCLAPPVNISTTCKPIPSKTAVSVLSTKPAIQDWIAVKWQDQDGFVEARKIAGAPFLHTDKLFARYDRIQGTLDTDALVFIKVPLIGPSVQLDLRVFQSDTLSALPEVYWVFSSTSGTQTEGWRFLKSHNLTLLLDNADRLRYEGVHDGDVGRVLLDETIVFRIPTADMLHIANARSIEGALGSWKFSLSPKETETVRQMAHFAAMDSMAMIPKRGKDK